MTGQVPRLPSAVLVTGMMILAFLSLVSGLILDNVTRGRWQTKRMSYLAARSAGSEKSVKALAAKFWAQRFVRFAAVGGAGFFVNEARFCSPMNCSQAGDKLGWFVAFIPAVTFTWWGNRNLTFAEHASEGHAHVAEWARFVAANGLGAVANFAVYAVLTAYAPWPFRIAYIALAIGILVGLVFNFTLSKRLVFRRR